MEDGLLGKDVVKTDVPANKLVSIFRALNYGNGNNAEILNGII
jgi:hypothetical protein